MPSPPSLAENQTASFRWWFLPSWLGLDAPCVVLTWTWAVSRASHTPLLTRPSLALFWVVWSIYLADRLIDVARCPDWTQATGRLRFGREYQAMFWLGLGACGIGLTTILAFGLPADVLGRAILVALGVSGHFLLFVLPLLLRSKLPGKEFGVGLFFALGAYACLGATTATLPLLGSIALVVAFNCLVIAARDADSDRTNDPGGASQWWRSLPRDLGWIGATLTLAATLAALFRPEMSFYIALAAALALLTLLHANARHLSGDAVRALADFALLTPWLATSFAVWLEPGFR